MCPVPLDKALLPASELPDREQDAADAVPPDEVESERRWAASFAKSQDLLSELAAEARARCGAGKKRTRGTDSVPRRPTT
jgi:hypothetical protein